MTLPLDTAADGTTMTHDWPWPRHWSGFGPRVQNRTFPHRHYTDNIEHNPFTWMGIWTPHGWRVHPKRFGKAEPYSRSLSGDGVRSCFPRALCDPASGLVEWQDDLHLRNDPFTDTGHYPCDPRVEYPVGQQRWAISHTLLCYPFADHTLYTHEYVWDIRHGLLRTHFREHVVEEARTDSRDGMTVRVRHRPISTAIEGNVCYPLLNSAVRGVWSDPQRLSHNHYARTVTRLLPMHNSTYGVVPDPPIVQCWGIWPVLADDPIDELFDPETGLCRDEAALVERCAITLDQPRLGLTRPDCVPVASKIYESTRHTILGDPYTTLNEGHAAQVRVRVGSRFARNRVGYAAATEHGMDTSHYTGYGPQFDYNNDGLVGEDDLALIESNLGRRIRQNAYVWGYFGGDWVSVGISLHHEHPSGVPAVVRYDRGAGYDSDSGVVQLFDTPGPDKPVWVEYHYDKPADAGRDNIKVHLYREPRA